MIDVTLAKAPAICFRHAARHRADFAGIATSIADFGAVESHGAYLARLRAAPHAHKHALWALVE